MQYKEFSGVDITKEKMEGAPTTHYHMGGIKVDAETNQTVVSGLFAAGEAATGLHGANRLGGNSLADLLVFGKRTGEEAAKFAKNAKLTRIAGNEASAEVDRVLSFLQVKDPVNPYEVFEKLRETMSSNVGIWRNEDGLNKALAEIAELKKVAGNVGVSGSTKFNPGLVTALEVQGLLNIAEMLVTAARERKESRGAHYRQDYPELRKEWRKNIVFVRKQDGGFTMRFDPVPELPPELKALLSKEEQENV